MPRFAAIDVGSNALRLRIVEAAGCSREAQLRAGRPHAEIVAQEWRELCVRRASVRLGGDVFVSGTLPGPVISEACEHLREFRLIMDQLGVVAYRATATSAVREAENGQTLVERVRREAGLDLDVIDGVEEARLIQLAVRRKIQLSARRALLVDVGGGSTELTMLDSGASVFSASLPLGTIRLLETHLRGDSRMDPDRLRACYEHIDSGLAEVARTMPTSDVALLIGTGGNVETLADLASPQDDQGAPRGIDITAAEELIVRLAGMTHDDRRGIFGLRPDRADTIVPALAIFLRVARLVHQGFVLVPGVGLAAGILEELVDRYFTTWDTADGADHVIDACVRVGKRYAFDEAHGHFVASCAAQIFDSLAAVRTFAPRDRVLLRAAAVLHDVGDFVHYDGHHKHSYYLILHSDIMGLSREERAIVANIARYHRRSVPDLARHPNFRELGESSRARVVALSAILRVADALDRDHTGRLRGIVARLDPSRKVLSLSPSPGEQGPIVGVPDMADKVGLFQEVFGYGIELESGRLAS